VCKRAIRDVSERRCAVLAAVLVRAQLDNSAQMSSKRKNPEDDDDESDRRVASKASDDSESWVDEYKCPITQELPTDPVMAEDGRCYESSAIEDWFSKQTCGSAIAKSPVTNLVIGRRLVPAVQIRNAIERLIDTGLIVGEPARAWKEKVGDTARMTPEMKKIWQKAHKGVPAAMTDVGFAYRDGADGLPKDFDKAAVWLRKAALHDEPHSVQCLGVFYTNGTGVEKDMARAFIELSRAAMLGSEHAAICIGRRLDGGSGVMKKDRDAARFWFNLSKKAKHHDSCADYVKQRDEWLAKHGTNYTHSRDQ
jgi:TPR repeat protein